MKHVEHPVIDIGGVMKISIDKSATDETILCVALVKDGNINVMETYSGEEALEAYDKFKQMKGE